MAKVSRCNTLEDIRRLFEMEVFLNCGLKSLSSPRYHTLCSGDNSDIFERSDGLRVVKRIESLSLCSVATEIAVFANLRHRNIMEARSLRFDFRGGLYRLDIAMAKGMPLRNFLSFIASDRKIVENMATQMIEGLAALQNFGLIHGDIKVENAIVLIEACPTLKLIDFSISFGSEAGTRVGQTYPDVEEIERRRSPQEIRLWPCDQIANAMWALGITLLDIMCPRKGRNRLFRELQRDQTLLLTRQLHEDAEGVLERPIFDLISRWKPLLLTLFRRERRLRPRLFRFLLSPLIVRSEEDHPCYSGEVLILPSPSSQVVKQVETSHLCGGPDVIREWFHQNKIFDNLGDRKVTSLASRISSLFYHVFLKPFPCDRDFEFHHRHFSRGGTPFFVACHFIASSLCGYDHAIDCYLPPIEKKYQVHTNFLRLVRAYVIHIYRHSRGSIHPSL